MSRTYKDAPYTVRAWRRDSRYGKCPSDWRGAHWRNWRKSDFPRRLEDYDAYIQASNAEPRTSYYYDGRKAYTKYGFRGWSGTVYLKQQEHHRRRMREREAIAHEDYDNLPTRQPNDFYWYW
jgi:hypothetical protein